MHRGRWSTCVDGMSFCLCWTCSSSPSHNDRLEEAKFCMKDTKSNLCRTRRMLVPSSRAVWDSQCAQLDRTCSKWWSCLRRWWSCKHHTPCSRSTPTRCESELSSPTMTSALAHDILRGTGLCTSRTPQTLSQHLSRTSRIALLFSSFLASTLFSQTVLQPSSFRLSLDLPPNQTHSLTDTYCTKEFSPWQTLIHCRAECCSFNSALLR